MYRADDKVLGTISGKMSAMHEDPLGSFGAMQPARERRLAGRLEGFADIVFGFAVSQCALQLVTARGQVDLTDPLALVLYFSTFAILASLWMMFHRIVSGAFAPVGIDLFGAFAFLAFVSLIPYAMDAATHAVGSGVAARAALARYTALYCLTTAVAAALNLRNLRRGWTYGDAAEHDRVWRALLRQSVVSALMGGASIIDVGFGPAPGSISLVTIPVAIRLARIRFGRTPSANKLRIKRREH